MILAASDSDGKLPGFEVIEVAIFIEVVLFDEHIVNTVTKFARAAQRQRLYYKERVLISSR
jgi:hypothetical protein